MFVFSNSFEFWEEISRSKNEIPWKYYFKFAENLHKPKNFVHHFNWSEFTYVFEMSWKFENVAFSLQSAPTLQVPSKFKLQEIKFMIKNIAFSLNAKCYKLISESAEIQLRDIQIWWRHISLHAISADDVGPRQDPKSHRTSHITLCNILWFFYKYIDKINITSFTLNC